MLAPSNSSSNWECARLIWMWSTLRHLISDGYAYILHSSNRKLALIFRHLAFGTVFVRVIFNLNYMGITLILDFIKSNQPFINRIHPSPETSWFPSVHPHLSSVYDLHSICWKRNHSSLQQSRRIPARFEALVTPIYSVEPRQVDRSLWLAWRGFLFCYSLLQSAQFWFSIYLLGFWSLQHPTISILP